MRQAIETQYSGPTNKRGAAVLVQADPGRRWYAWKHAYDVDTNHRLAAQAYAEEHGWSGEWRGGSTAKGYAFVLVEGDRDFTAAPKAQGRSR